jgi:hypothetical protein
MPTETATSTPTSKTKAAESCTYGSASSTIELDVTQGDCKVELQTAPGGSGDITLTYTLEDDRTGTASIRPYYSTGGISGTYVEMTKGTGGNAKTNLTTAATPTTFTFVWDTVTDLGIDFKGLAHIKVKAYDRDDWIGDTMESSVLGVNVDNAPAAPTITTPADGLFSKDETPPIVGTIPNHLHIKIEIATDSTFDTIEQTFESRLDQDGWQYDSDGAGAWLEIPSTGIPIVSDPTLIGNSWRFTVQTEDKLTIGLKYIRAFCGGLG